jgi:predicted secreted hydrolase
MMCLLLAGCTSPEPPHSSGGTPSNDAVDNALRADPDDGFAMLYEPQPLQFPEDHLPHPDYRTEWWYMTGNLDAADGRRFGFQVTWFRQGMTRVDHKDHTTSHRTASHSTASHSTSRWVAHDAWMGHVGVSDVSRETFHQAHRFARGAVGLAGATQNGNTTEIFLDRWQLDMTENPEKNQAQLRLAVDTEATQLRLTGTRNGPTILRGNQGHSQKSATPGNASMYYVWPRIEMAGTLLIEGEEVAVTGQAWLDREWGSSLLDEEQAGWDWFALHLDDGSDLMVYSLRRKDGGIDPYAVAHRTSAAGLNERWQPTDWSLTPLKYWTSPVTGSTWPISWRLEIPTASFDATVTAVFPNQEHHGAFAYWEGTVDVIGTQSGTPLGRGYLEMTGH